MCLEATESVGKCQRCKRICRGLCRGWCQATNGNLEDPDKGSDVSGKGAPAEGTRRWLELATEFSPTIRLASPPIPFTNCDHQPLAGLFLSLFSLLLSP